MPVTVAPPLRLMALPAEQAEGFRAAARAAVERPALEPAAMDPSAPIAAPTEGMHRTILVEPGQAVTLAGPAFRDAVYVVQPEGLVVLVEGGGSLLLPGLEAETAVVIDGLPPISIGELAAAPAMQPEPVQPAAGPPPAAHGGGAAFAADSVESIGSGAEITGALAGTGHDYGVVFGEMAGGRLDGLGAADSGPGKPGGGDPGGGDPGGGDNGSGDPGGGDPGGGDNGGGDPGDGDDGGGDPGPIANAAPRAGDDRAATAEDHRLTLRAADLLRNDSDADGTPLRITAVDGARHGQVVLNADGSVTFTPDADFNGDASFRYTVSDGEGGSDAATVRVAVRPLNDAPVAAADAVTTQEDRAIRIPAAELLGNDRDVDGDRLAIASVQEGRHGQAVLNGDGSVTFTPDADFHGQADFTYTVSDGKGGFDTATVRVEVSPVNDAPVAADDVAATDEDRAVRIEASALLGNDRDADGDRLTLTSVQDATHGEVTLNPDGSVTFVPHGGFNGEASFTYTISDGKGGLDTAGVTVHVAPVNDAPTAFDAAFTVRQDIPAESYVGHVLGGDPDSPATEHGRVYYAFTGGGPIPFSLFSPDGAFVIDPFSGAIFTVEALDPQMTGTHELEVVAMDGGGLFDIATVTITVDAADRVLTNRTDGGPIDIPEAALLRNDVDPKGGPLHIADVGGDQPVSLDGTGHVVLDPVGAGFAGAALTYTAADAGGRTGAPMAVQVVAVAGDLIEGGDADEIVLGRDGAADELRGGGGDDWLVGRSGADRLDGGDGHDVLDGGAGKDRLAGGNGKDDLRGDAGEDELSGDQGNDDLRGGAGKDVLDGGLGKDLLDGGAGDDVLTGGAGADRFRLTNLGGTDRIVDFQTGAGGDVIDLRAVLVGVGSESGAALQAWLQIGVAGGDSTISIDAEGGGDFATADARIVVEGADLLGGAVDQAAAIDSLVAGGNVQAQAA
jgi:Ca2+-binding RTX toxin-like protein